MTTGIKRKLYEISGRTFTYIAISIITIFFVFPFLWMVSTSIKPATEIFTPVPTIIPRASTVANYIYIFAKTIFPTTLKNSVIVAVSTTAVTLVFSVFFAYGLARFRFKGRTFVLNLLILTQMFPLSLLIIVIFTIFVKLNLIDNYIALIVSHCTFAIPFSTIMLKSYFDDMPIELEEAAAIDGCTPYGTIFRIVIPLASPAIVAMGIFAYILSWGEYMMSLSLIRSEAMRTVPVQLSFMIGFMEVQWGPLMAAATVITLPVVIVFIFFQKYMISGMTMGAVKG